jgi:hypothetical protein
MNQKQLPRTSHGSENVAEEAPGNSLRGATVVWVEIISCQMTKSRLPILRGQRHTKSSLNRKVHPHDDAEPCPL